MSGAASSPAQAAIERVAHVPVYGLVVDKMRRAIHNGSFVPGDKFPPERELSKQLGVSRASVREAIRVLEGEGYVETRRGASGGIIVLDRAQTEDRLAEVIRTKLPEIEQAIDFRLAVECSAARLAAVRRTDDDLARLRAAFETMAASRETRRFRAADSAFHQGIAAAARNDWMERSIEDARAFLWMTVDKVAENVFRTAQLHHGQILAAIEQGDPDAAERHVAAHIELTRTDLMRIAAAAPPQG
jgi:GntR family transcriptional regulator, transcriptional repressor for pyruvate dehydrogenase complex